MDDRDIYDAKLRQAGFDHVNRLSTLQGALTSDDLRAGFQIDGRRVPLINPQRGIFKPSEMPYLLSIRTVFPRKGARVWYDDQRKVHEQIFRGDELVDYAFMGTNPEAADNRHLREAMERQIPVIYFLGVSPGRYQAIVPTFILDWDPAALRARIGFGALAGSDAAARPPETIIERRYALRQVKQSLHQHAFRDAVIAAYGGRCAISGLPEPRLLDAAHIMADKDEEFGAPLITNGLPLSKIHHAAFDAHLIGIDPDGHVHVSDRLLELHDGPFLEEGIKAIAGRLIHAPRRDIDRPDRDRLAQRFEMFQRYRDST